MVRTLNDVAPNEQLPYLSAKEVAKLHEFYVLDAVYQPNAQFGPRYRYKIRYQASDGAGTNAYLTLSEGIEQRKQLADAFTSDRSPIGPLQLRSMRSRDGKRTIWLFFDRDAPHGGAEADMPEFDETNAPF
jgi:hypothetical protein